MSRRIYYVQRERPRPKPCCAPCAQTGGSCGGHKPSTQPGLGADYQDTEGYRRASGDSGWFGDWFESPPQDRYSCAGADRAHCLAGHYVLNRRQAIAYINRYGGARLQYVVTYRLPGVPKARIRYVNKLNGERVDIPGELAAMVGTADFASVARVEGRLTPQILEMEQKANQAQRALTADDNAGARDQAAKIGADLAAYCRRSSKNCRDSMCWGVLAKGDCDPGMDPKTAVLLAIAAAGALIVGFYGFKAGSVVGGVKGNYKAYKARREGREEGRRRPADAREAV